MFSTGIVISHEKWSALNSVKPQCLEKLQTSVFFTRFCRLPHCLQLVVFRKPNAPWRFVPTTNSASVCWGHSHQCGGEGSTSFLHLFHNSRLYWNPQMKLAKSSVILNKRLNWTLMGCTARCKSPRVLKKNNEEKGCFFFSPWQGCVIHEFPWWRFFFVKCVYYYFIFIFCTLTCNIDLLPWCITEDIFHFLSNCAFLKRWVSRHQYQDTWCQRSLVWVHFQSPTPIVLIWLSLWNCLDFTKCQTKNTFSCSAKTSS